MKGEELEEYYKVRKLSVSLITNSIDYENITNPIQSFQLKPTVFIISPNEHLKNKFIFQKHTLIDNTWRFQFFGGDKETEFLNLQKEVLRNNEYDDRRIDMMMLEFYLGEQHVIHQRRVYDIMTFLGDVGGIYGSMMLIGMAIHWLIAGD